MPSQTSLKEASNPSYDEVPYESMPYPFTHPQHLYTVGKLFGLSPPDFRTASVLELGCAGGGNLMPLAINYPKARFTGLDLSKEQIAHAEKQKQALGLKNIDFRQQNILEFAPKENFDYILCHGVLSWVPENVREKIFDICDKYLSPKGLAIITYNTLPGWNAVRSLREMILFHTGRFATPAEKIQQARLLLDFLAENALEENRGYRALIEDERNILRNAADYYFYHDHMETVNAQFYLHEFARMANDHNLTYVGDTGISQMYVDNFPQKTMEILKAFGDVITQEQYMDFVTNRRFRTSILCKSGQALNRNLKNEQVMDFYLTFNPALQVTGPDAQHTAVFQVNNGKFTTNNELSTTLYLELAAASPAPIAVKDLIARTQKKLGLKDDTTVRNALDESALPLVLRGFVSLHSDSPPHATEVGKKPKAYPLARLQAAVPNCKLVTNAFGASASVSLVDCIILQNLDGTKTAEDIVDILLKGVQSGALKMEKDNVIITDEKEVRKNLTATVNEILPKMAKHGLLVG